MAKTKIDKSDNSKKPPKVTKPRKTGGNLSEAAASEDIGFRRLSDKNMKGLNPITRDRQLKMVYGLFLKNGIAKRILEIGIDFVFGDGLDQIEARSKDGSISEETLKEVVEIINEFNDENEMDTEFERLYLDLRLNGMLIIPAFVNEYNGSVKLGFIDPEQLDEIKTNPMNIKDVMELQFKGKFTGDQKNLKVIRKASIFDSPDNYNLLEGETFFFAINNVSNQPEGVSDLLSSADLLDMLDQLIFNVIESTRLLNFFVLDVEISGANDDQLREWQKKNPIPNRPTRFVHNQKVKQEAIAPKLQAADQSEMIRMVKNLILGIHGFPPMWFADGQDANRAIAVEQGTPIFRKLLKQQKVAIQILKKIYLFVIHQAIIKREGFTLSRKQLASLVIDIKPPKLETKDYDKVAGVLTNIVEALTKAQLNGWISKKTTIRTFLQTLAQINADVNIEAEEKALQNEPPPIVPANPGDGNNNNLNPNE